MISINACLADNHFFPDIVLATYTCDVLCVSSNRIAVYKYGRLSIGLLGGAAVMLIVLCGVALILFNKEVAALTEPWDFYVGVSIPTSMMLLALWYRFDPAVVRFNDFRKDIE